MPPIYKPTQSAECWKEFLAKPDLHWKTGYSARSMAHAWEDNQGMPPRIRSVLEASFGTSVEALFVVPEYKVKLPGGRTESQNDAFVFARLGDLTAAIMIEGKVAEPFGPRIGEWHDTNSKGKLERLNYLCGMLGLQTPPDDDLRYQLFHRTASAVIEAKKFKTDVAIMLIHSFAQDHKWFEDYAKFADALGVSPVLGELSKVTTETAIPLYIGWVTGDPKYLTR